MSPKDAIRFLHHEARACRDRDAHEALCLLLPAILQALDLEPMGAVDAGLFRLDLVKTIRENYAVRPSGRTPQKISA